MAISAVRPYRNARRYGRAPTRPVALPLLRIVAEALLLSSIFLVAALVGEGTMTLADRLLRRFTRVAFRAANATLVVSGREHFADGRAAIVMSNHRSAFDAPAILAAVPAPLRMVMKESLGRIPLLGWAARLAGFVPIARSNRRKAIRQLDVAKKMLARSIHVWIAPEGTYSTTGVVLPLKRGGFHLAVQFGAPIIPAFIQGTDRVVMPGSARVARGQTIVVRFGAPIETAGREIDAIMTETRLAIAALDEEPQTAQFEITNVKATRVGGMRGARAAAEA